MINLANPEIWFVSGSQHLYGPGPLQQVAAHAREIASALADSLQAPAQDRIQGAADDARTKSPSFASRRTPIPTAPA